MNLKLWTILLWLIFAVILCGTNYYLFDKAKQIESLQAENADMRSKIVFLENNDWAYIIRQLPPIIQDELALLNERIRQKKITAPSSKP